MKPKITIIIILILIIGTGLFYFGGVGNFIQDKIGLLKEKFPPQTKEEVQKVEEEKTQTEQATGTEEVESFTETADWVTYTDEEHGFEVQYPSNWNTHKDSERFGFSKEVLTENNVKKSCAITVYWELFDSFSFSNCLPAMEEWVNPSSKCELIDPIGNTPAKECLRLPEYPGISTYIFGPDPNKNWCFGIGLFSAKYIKGDNLRWVNTETGREKIEECEAVKKDVISSFKFLGDQSLISGNCIYRKGDYDVRLYDLQGRATGMFDGELKEEIPNVSYDKERKIPIISNLEENYIWEFYCKEEGNYQFNAVYTDRGQEFVFIAFNIPIKKGESHRYKFDWEALKKGEDGVMLFVDEDGDGIFDKMITADHELTCEEYFDTSKNWQFIPG